MAVTTPHLDQTRGTVKRTSVAVLSAAWAVPVFVVGGFAFLSGIPIAVALIGTLRDSRLRALRWATGSLAAFYTVAMGLWLLGPSTEPSLTKFLSPIATAAFVAIGAGVAIAHHIVRRWSAGR